MKEFLWYPEVNNSLKELLMSWTEVSKKHDGRIPSFSAISDAVEPETFTSCYCNQFDGTDYSCYHMSMKGKQNTNVIIRGNVYAKLVV